MKGIITDCNSILNKSEAFFSTRKTQGVYFLMIKNEIVYIGSSVNCEKRILTHRKNPKLRFKRYHIIEYKGYFNFDAVAAEDEYIKHYKPRYNKKGNPDYHEGRKSLWFSFLANFESYTEITKLTGLSISVVRSIISEERIIEDEAYKLVADVLMQKPYNKKLELLDLSKSKELKHVYNEEGVWLGVLPKGEKRKIMTIKVEVNGSTRIVRDKFIHHQTENNLECYYKNHHINITKQEIGDYYVTVTDQTGMYAVDGGFGGDWGEDKHNSIEGCLTMAIENILI